VRESGRVWTLRYRAKQGRGRGRQRRITLGQLGGPVALDTQTLFPDFEVPAALTLEGARSVARALAGLAARGVDPLGVLDQEDEERRRRSAEAKRRRNDNTETFGALLDRFLEVRRDGNVRHDIKPVRPATLELWQSLARAELKPALGDRDPRGITRSEVKALHRRIGETRQVWANRALELIAGVFGWAVREDLLPSSPVVDIRPFKEQSRTHVLSSDEIARVWAALDPEVYGDAIRLLFLTGARRGEVLGMPWSEIDFPARLWRIAADRSKTGHPRSVPSVVQRSHC
jgi:hypothetical protein